MQRELTLGLLITSRGGAVTRREVEGVRTSVRALTGASAQARVGQTLGAGARSASRELVTLDRATVRASRSVEALTRRATEHGRALRAARAETRRLTQDQQRLAETSEHATRALTRRERWGRRADTVLTTAGGIAAGGYVATRPLTREMPYEQRLAYLSQTAYAGRSLDERRQGRATLAAAIQRAVREGGGTREGATDALDALIASGTVSIEDAIKMLPGIVQRATGGNASAVDFANIVITAMRNAGLDTDQAVQALDMTLAGGWAGSFEGRDMAKWLPRQMAAARGMRGEVGVAKLIAANQAAMTTAGTSDEAGNNLANLLGKLSSPDTAKAFKDQGIDLTGSLMRLRKQGFDPLDATAMLMDHIASRDKGYKRLKAKIDKAPKGEKRELMEQQIDLLQGSIIGQVFHDREALSALVGLLNQRQYVKDVQKKALDARGVAGPDAYANVSDTAGFQAQRLANEKTFAEQRIFDSFKTELAGAAKALADYAAQYPGLTQAVTGATEALYALGIGLGAAGAWRVLTGPGKAPSGASGAAAEAKTATPAATGAAASGGAAVGARFLANAAVPAVIAGGMVAALTTVTASANRDNPASAFFNPADAAGDDAWTRRQKWVAENYSWWQRFKADSHFGTAEPRPGSEAAKAAERGVRGTPDAVYDRLLRDATGMLATAFEATQKPPSVNQDNRATYNLRIDVKADADPEQIAAVARRELERVQAEQAKRLRGVIDDIPMPGP